MIRKIWKGYIKDRSESIHVEGRVAGKESKKMTDLYVRLWVLREQINK